MSMTAYNILECQNARINTSAPRTRARPSPSPSSRRVGDGGYKCYAQRRAPRVLYVYKDTRPSGERESGSYSGTWQRNHIPFGPSKECWSG